MACRLAGWEKSVYDSLRNSDKVAVAIYSIVACASWSRMAMARRGPACPRRGGVLASTVELLNGRPGAELSIKTCLLRSRSEAPRAFPAGSPSPAVRDLSGCPAPGFSFARYL